MKLTDLWMSLAMGMAKNYRAKYSLMCITIIPVCEAEDNSKQLSHSDIRQLLCIESSILWPKQWFSSGGDFIS